MAKTPTGTAPPAPEPEELPADSPHRDLWLSVRRTIYALPSFFESDLILSGILATDLHTFNTSLGATIETQVVKALNKLRHEWDPAQGYSGYSFVRQSQTFPDVILRAASPDADAPILMGMELKGWYILAKEREPSFRFQVTPNVCAPPDLLVVFPWALSNVVSGTPVLFRPFVAPARHVAAYRNWFWQYAKKGKGADTGITLSEVSQPYPIKSDAISDRAVSDQGGNFGRIARVRIMDDYMRDLFREELLGIPLDSWQRFLSLFAEGSTEDQIARRLERMAEAAAKEKQGMSAERLAELRTHLEAVAKILGA